MEIEAKDLRDVSGGLIGVGPVESESGLVLVDGAAAGLGGGVGGGFRAAVGGLITGLDGNALGLVGTVGRGVGVGVGIGVGTGGALSDDEDRSLDGDGVDGGGGGGLGGGGKTKKNSPWQRMKWTDAMVKLLISVVLFIGEDPNGADATTANANDGSKRKTGTGLLQKKGKWKSVSKVMMDKGCYVSPQQCEDKFNDLNKRYKRLNDILGKGTASTVVENPNLLDAMGTLSAKAKEDVRKILSSKHLFYKEMAHYHSGNKAALAGDLEFQQSSFQNALIPGVRETLETARQFRDVMDDDDDEDEDEDENEADENDVEDDYDGLTGVGVTEDGRDGMGDLRELFSKRRKLSKKMEEVELGLAASALHDYGSKEISGVELVNTTELMGVLQEQELGKGSDDHDLDPQFQWMKDRTMQLEEQKVGLQAEAFNLEKQRFKWQKLSWKKDHEIERLRLENERMKLETERKEEAVDDVVIGDLSDPFGKTIKKLEEVELGTITGPGFPDYTTSKEITGVDLVNTTTDIMGILQDSSSSSKAPQEQHQQWIRNRTIQLEEQKVCLQVEAFNLEKERFKWQKLSWKTDHEIERMRLENDRIKLENERRALQLKQKELLLQFLRTS